MSVFVLKFQNHFFGLICHFFVLRCRKLTFSFLALFLSKMFLNKKGKRAFIWTAPLLKVLLYSIDAPITILNRSRLAVVVKNPNKRIEKKLSVNVTKTYALYLSICVYPYPKSMCLSGLMSFLRLLEIFLVAFISMTSLIRIDNTFFYFLVSVCVIFKKSF